MCNKERLQQAGGLHGCTILQLAKGPPVSVRENHDEHMKGVTWLRSHTGAEGGLQ